jgi:hypothetical protein
MKPGTVWLHVCLWAVILAACAGSESLPASASQVVLKEAQVFYTSPYLGADPFDLTPEISVERAWLGSDEEQFSGQPILWCVQLLVSGQRRSVEVTESPVWIAVPDETGTGWVAAALVTISSNLPWERCGQVPGEGVMLQMSIK